MRASYAGADERRRSRGVTYPQSSRTLLVISSVPRSIAASAAVPRSRRPYPRISRGFFAPVSPRQDPEGRSRGERPKPNPAEPEPNRPLHQPSPVMVPTRPNSWKFQISSEIKTPAINGGQRPSATLQEVSGRQKREFYYIDTTYYDHRSKLRHKAGNFQLAIVRR